MNAKQQAILTRQTDELTTTEAEMHKPVSDLTARIASSRLELNGQLTQDETDQLNSDLADKSPRQQKRILNAWYNYAENKNIYNAAKVRVAALTTWDGSTIWINKNRNSQNVFLWKDYFSNIILQWQQIDADDLTRRGEIVRVGYFVPSGAWTFSLTDKEYDDFVARCNGQAPAAPKRQLQGGFLASETDGNYGKRRYR